MANKTKKELLEEIEKLNEVIGEKEQDLVKYEHISTCMDMAEEYKLIYDKYEAAGFTKKEAFELLKIAVERTINDFMRETTNGRRRNSYGGYRGYGRY